MVKTPSNETPALTKSMNMDIWVVGKSNQLFIRGSWGTKVSRQKGKISKIKKRTFKVK